MRFEIFGRGLKGFRETLSLRLDSMLIGSFQIGEGSITAGDNPLAPGLNSFLNSDLSNLRCFQEILTYYHPLTALQLNICLFRFVKMLKLNKYPKVFCAMCIHLCCFSKRSKLCVNQFMILLEKERLMTASQQMLIFDQNHL